MKIQLYLKLAQDHLHIRGEYNNRLVYHLVLSGSPPHTWRIRSYGQRTTIFIRITSTYVENTQTLNSINTQQQDHLHIRGEYLYVQLQALQLQGSPPHTWRILKSGLELRCRMRITSTYVENTEATFSVKSFNWDHLHIRGEYLTTITAFSLA